jgi:hypothetical protein
VARVHVQILNHYDYWRRQRTIREGLVVSVVVALAVGGFLGVIHVIASGLPPRAAAWISSFSDTSAVSDDDYDGDTAAEDDTAAEGDTESPSAD